MKVYCKDGKVYDTTNKVVDKPCILVDKETSTFHGWGSEEFMTQKYNTIVSAYNENGFTDMASACTLISLADLDVRYTVYIVNRLLLFSATSFARDLLDRMDGNKDIFFGWLNQEMERVPIE